MLTCQRSPGGGPIVTAVRRKRIAGFQPDLLHALTRNQHKMPFFGMAFESQPAFFGHNLRKGTQFFGLILKASMVGFTLLSRSLTTICVDEVPAGPPFPPDHRQAGERGAMNVLTLSRNASVLRVAPRPGGPSPRSRLVNGCYNILFNDINCAFVLTRTPREPQRPTPDVKAMSCRSLFLKVPKRYHFRPK